MLSCSAANINSTNSTYSSSINKRFSWHVSVILLYEIGLLYLSNLSNACSKRQPIICQDITKCLLLAKYLRKIMCINLWLTKTVRWIPLCGSRRRWERWNKKDKECNLGIALNYRKYLGKLIKIDRTWGWKVKWTWLFSRNASKHRTALVQSWHIGLGLINDHV